MSISSGNEPASVSKASSVNPTTILVDHVLHVSECRPPGKGDQPVNEGSVAESEISTYAMEDPADEVPLI
jgi:hypothetical protein